MNNILLNLRYKFNNDYILKENSSIKPYLYAGAGYLFDNMDKGLNFDAGVGTKFALGENTALYIEGGYINGINTTIANIDRSDDFLKLTAGLEFAFGKAKDSDGDGVSDKKDKCPDTPAGVKVDVNGCPLDKDGDGIPDYKDDCPDVAGLAQYNGCPDRDGDGIIDKEDACPDVAGLKKFKGCPDTDEDGVIDSKDKCPNTPKGCAVDADGCPLDTDKDGIIDCEDNCPTVAGLKENKGCPAEWEEINLGPVYFDFDKSNIRPDAAAILDQVISKLNSSAGYEVVIAGHTCNLGTEPYNQGLSEKRAQNVVKYLISKGINNAYVGANGYGELKPAVPNTSKKNRELNRRAEFEIKIKRKF
jgi:outer membrane protein OmpA-like peptidoglycan-associated protein